MDEAQPGRESASSDTSPRPAQSPVASTAEDVRPNGPLIGMAAWARSLAAAGGAAVGTVLAIPMGGILFAVLFERLGTAIIRDITSGALEDASGVEAVVVGIFVVIGALMAAVLVVVALVTPVFVLLPTASTALALRVAGAGLIARSLLVGMGVVVVLAGGMRVASSAVDLDYDWWTWVLVTAGGALVGRLVVEAWKPAEAGQRHTGAKGWRRWSRLGMTWVALVVLAIVLVLLLVRLLPVTLEDLVVE
jgi:hypothetical protein